jgi:hypothetical protein
MYCLHHVTYRGIFHLVRVSNYVSRELIFYYAHCEEKARNSPCSMVYLKVPDSTLKALPSSTRRFKVLTLDLSSCLNILILGIILSVFLGHYSNLLLGQMPLLMVTQKVLVISFEKFQLFTVRQWGYCAFLALLWHFSSRSN